MDIYPIWRTTYYESDETEAIFRITSSGETIFEGKATRKPDEDSLLINLNKPCANAIDSILHADSMSADTLVHQNAYKVFDLDFLNTTTEQWVNVYQFAFFNDWSYENRADRALNDPINGHSRGGQIITASALVTGSTGQICYQTSYWLMVRSGGCAYFDPAGGTWTIDYITNIDLAYYSFNNGQITGYTSGGTLTLELPANTGYTRTDYYVKFYDTPGGAQIGKAEAHVVGNQPSPGPEPPYSGDTSEYENQYLTLEILSGGTIAWSGDSTTYYSMDSGATWTAMPSSLTVNAGDIIWLKSNSTRSRRDINEAGWDDVYYNAYGNIMSLLYGDNFIGQKDIPETSAYTNTLQFAFGNTHIVSAEDLVLPATGLTEGCYSSMFRHCNDLTTPPKVLPADYLATGCYQQMFEYCSSLTKAPEIPATYLGKGCYMGMFAYCTSLTAAPELPATTLKPDGADRGNSCYEAMFLGCTSLTQAPMLPATDIANSCYQSMFEGCTALRIPPDLPATSLYGGCYQYMFKNCSSLLYAPVLPAPALWNRCYYFMFEGCTSLTVVPAELPATTLYDYCYRGMFYGCTSITTAPALRATTLADGCYESMFKHCTSLTTAPDLIATTPVDLCYQEMFYGCTSLNYVKCLTKFITYVENGATNWLYNVSATGTFEKEASANWPSGASGIPNGWTVVNAT